MKEDKLDLLKEGIDYEEYTTNYLKNKCSGCCSKKESKNCCDSCDKCNKCYINKQK